MGRPSKLTPEQCAEIERRLLAGESYGSLAKVYGVTKAAIVQRFSKRIVTVKSVANQIVSTERAIGNLPIGQQIQAQTLASRWMRIADNMTSGADFASASFMRLSALANSELQKVDDADPMMSAPHLKGFATLTKLANEAADAPIRMTVAMKAALADTGQEEGVRITGGLPD